MGDRPRTIVRHLALALVVLAVSACGGAEDPGSEAATTDSLEQAAPTEESEEPAEDAGQPTDGEQAEPDPEDERAAEDEAERTLVATSVVAEVAAYAEPAVDAEVTHTLNHPTDRGVPRVFLVDERRDGWLKVLLPVRPNGSTGWIREDDVELAWNPYEVHVDLEAFQLTIHREEELVLEAPIGYGDEDTPTPGGRYYITELLQPPDPGGVYGTYAFGLSGFSDVHLSFAGGEGVIGIHGTNAPESIGSTVSNGCIRVHNDVISEMATFLPLGTPVTIE